MLHGPSSATRHFLISADVTCLMSSYGGSSQLRCAVPCLQEASDDSTQGPQQHGGSPNVHLLYRPGHYDVMYPY